MADPRVVVFFALSSFIVLGGYIGSVYAVLSWQTGAIIGFLIGCLYGVWYARHGTEY